MPDIIASKHLPLGEKLRAAAFCCKPHADLRRGGGLGTSAQEEGELTMEHIAISVIVPIYNTKPYLEECIESILAQKINVPIEVLLIDDGSTDGCAEICDKYAARDERVRVIHQENQGLVRCAQCGH